MSDVRTSADCRVVKAANYLTIRERRVFFEVFSSGKRESPSGVQWSGDRVAVFHAKTVEDVLKVQFLRQVQCSMAPVTMDFYAEVFSGVVVPLHIIELSKVFASRIHHCGTVGDD